MAVRQPTKVVFDIGNVLLRWDPRNLYRKVFADEAKMEWFLNEICSMGWHGEQDRGRGGEEAMAELVARHPEWETEIRAFYGRWEEMFAGVFEENVAVLERLRAAGVPTYAITNYPAEQFRLGRARFPFLNGFDGIVVSGEERLMKPDRAIFELFFRRTGLEPEDCVFIDDSRANIEAAQALGMHTIHYVEPLDLAAELRRMGLPA